MTKPDDLHPMEHVGTRWMTRPDDLRAALERELNAPTFTIRTAAARALLDKAKASRTGEVTITAQELAVLLPAIEGSAVFLAIHAALSQPAASQLSVDNRPLEQRGLG